MGLYSMKKYELYLIEILLFISIIMFNIVYKSVLFQNLVIIILAIYSLSRFGFMKDNNYLKSTVIKMVISCILIYLVTIYILGLILGFNRTPASLSIDYFIRVISFDALVIVAEEIMRYVIARNTQHKKIPLIVYTIILVILNIIIGIKGVDLRDNERLFIFITTVIVPAASVQAICSYLTYKVSYVPSLIFKLIMVLYELVMPIIPNLGYYLYASSNILICYFIYFICSKSIDKASKAKTDVKKSYVRMLYVPILLFLIGIILLVSGLLTYKMIAIGSNSMVPAYYRGDAVIYKKIDPLTVEKGDILVFRKDGVVITHRIVNIYDGEGSRIIKTKGDANESEDSFMVYDSEVLGIVKCRVKYIGYPTLWLNELFRGREIND